VIVLATSLRVQIANYIDVLAYVYAAVIFVYIITLWVFAVGLRIPYSRTSNAILNFLRDVSEPYLRIFRRIVPSFGALDFSPVLAILLLVIVVPIVANAIRG
jgi:YggT family protein